MHTSNEILMFSIWGRFLNRSAAAQVLLFFDDFSNEVKTVQILVFFDTFPFRMFEML